MMKSVAATLVFALYALILPFTVGTAVAVDQYDAPHYDPGSGYTCVTCHTPNQTLGSAGSDVYNNICLSCHRPGDPKAGTMPLALVDQANLTLPLQSTDEATPSHGTSHRWDGPDTAPWAGAQPPQLAGMDADNLRTRTGSSLACVRCHDPHKNDVSCAQCHDPNFGGTTLNTNGTVINANFPRISNDNDQMCLDCHRTRNVSSHLQGSHPVLINYTTVAKANPDSFYNPPRNASFTNNTTSDLNARLVVTGRQIVCSTCHGVHYADSRSSTRDGKAAFATLSSGDGYLLRTERRGASVAANQTDSVNICTNCHAGKLNHNNGNQDIQCNDCHGAHVEYDPADPTGAKGVNAYLIRRNISNAAQINKIFYRYTAAAKKEFFNSADPTTPGLCQGCHAAVPDTGMHTGATSNNCSDCHNHSNYKGSFAPACTKCHPNLSPSHAAHVGNILPLITNYSISDNYFNNRNSDSTGYRFGCAFCHPTVNPGHGNGTIVLNGSNGFAGVSKTSITCSASSCHSDGKASVASPDWYIGYTGSDRCAMCHASSPATGSHTAHLSVNGIHAGSSGIDYGSATNFGCEKCHASTVNSAKAIVSYQNHVNGSANVLFNSEKIVSKAQISPASFGAYSTVWTRTGSSYKVDATSVDVSKQLLSAGSYAGGSCSTIACHNNGVTPDWNTTAVPRISCVDCHSAL